MKIPGSLIPDRQMKITPSDGEGYVTNAGSVLPPTKRWRPFL